MKKIYLILSLLPSLSFAQLTTPNAQLQNTTNPSTGNVGIGTNNPSEKLEVRGNLKVNSQGTHTGLHLGNEHNDAIITDGTDNKHYGGGYFFRVHNDNIPHKYIDAMMLADNGNIGIGTNNPSEKLEVRGNLKVNSQGTHTGIHLGNEHNDAIITDGTHNKHYGGGYFFRVHNDNIPHKYIDVMMLDENGNVGIGNHNPKHKLDVNGSFRAGNEDNQFTYNGHADVILKFKDRGNGGRAIVHDAANTLTLNYDEDFNGGTRLGRSFLVKGNSASLQGKLEAKEIKVTETPTADFVFEEDYALPTLQEVEQHIKEKKHLPEIASAKEMEKEGVNVGKFQIQLLQKIEELTLYIIEQNKETNKLHTTVLEQQKQIENLTNKLEQISHEK